MIDDSPGSFSPLETARNRLAKTLFGLCSLLLILALTANESAMEFSAKERQLAERVSKLHEVQGRLVSFLDMDASYLRDRLKAAFDVMCLTGAEAGRSQLKPGTVLVLGPSAIEDTVSNGLATRRCKSEFLQVQVQSAELLRSMSTVLSEMLTDNRIPPALAVKTIRPKLSTIDKARWDLLIGYWGEDGLATLMVSRWFDWRSMNAWVLSNAQRIWVMGLKQNRALAEITDYITGGNSGYVGSSLGTISDGFKKADYVDWGIWDDLLVMRLANDGTQAFATLQSRLKDALQEQKAHSPELKWSSASVGGLTVPLLQWLDWMPLLVVALLALFATFNDRAYAQRSVNSNDFWFPRLGRPRDPLAERVSDFSQWPPTVFWFAHWVLPIVLCYWAAVLRFNSVGGWGFTGVHLSRRFIDHPADWLNSIALLVCIVLVVQATKPNSEGSGLNPRVSKLVLALCCTAALGASALVGIDQFFIRTDYAGKVVPTLFDGQVYLVVLSVAVAGIVLWNRRLLSRFAAFILCALSIVNFAFVLRTAM